MEDRFNRYLFALYFSYAAIPVVWRCIFDNFININGPELQFKDYSSFASLMFGLSMAHAISFIPIANIFVRAEDKNNRAIALRYCFLSITVEAIGLYVIFGHEAISVDGFGGYHVQQLGYFVFYLPARFVFMLIMCGLAATTAIIVKDDDIKKSD